MKLNELPVDLFPLIYSFLYQFPLKSYEKYHDQENGSTLAFPHSCSKILTSLDSYTPFQFDKFIQFYCLGIKNQRYEQLERIILNNELVELKQVLPIVFYLNFPELNFIEHLEFERDLVPMERKFRKYLLVDRGKYEDFLFKIDRIIEMLSAFVNLIKKKLGVENLNEAIDQIVEVNELGIQLPISSLISVIENADRVINKCMKIFHWKAYRDYYFEEEYFQVPKEFTLVSKKYRDCERIITILKNDESFERSDELIELLSNLECYYCDKLSASISQLFFQGQYARNRNNFKLVRMMLYYGMYNRPSIYNTCSEEIKNDEEIVKRFVYYNPQLYSDIPLKFKSNSSIIETCILQSEDSIEAIYEEEVGRDVLISTLIQNPEIFCNYLSKSKNEEPPVEEIIKAFIEKVKDDSPHPALQSLFNDRKLLESLEMKSKAYCQDYYDDFEMPRDWLIYFFSFMKKLGYKFAI